MSNRGSEHNRVQKQGKVRDLYVCQVCGSKNCPEGHHVLNFQHGGAANKDNIVTLCRSCHKEVHKGNIDLLVF